MRRSLLSITAAAALIALHPLSASAQEVTTTVSNWSQAAQLVGPEGSLWVPKFTANTRLSGKVSVVLSEPDAMTVSASYARGKREFTIAEKFADRQWAAEPASDIGSALVGKPTIAFGPPGQRIPVQVSVYANCYLAAYTGNAKPPKKSFRCAQGDVWRFGGELRMTAKPSSTMTAPGDTTIVITSNGLTYQQLLQVARGLQQISGS
jgi:hypothetical protein